MENGSLGTLSDVQFEQGNLEGKVNNLLLLIVYVKPKMLVGNTDPEKQAEHLLVQG